jgi:hypothetical protein
VFGSVASDGVEAMPGVLAMLGMVDGEIGGSGWPGGGIVSPARGAYGPTCGAIEAGAACCNGMVVAGTAATATADVGCAGGVLP